MFFDFRKWLDVPGPAPHSNGTGKVAVISGTSTNIVKHLALSLAKTGVRVILTSENTLRLKKIRQHIAEQCADADVKCMHMDLTSFASVREFAVEFLKFEKRLDYLVNIDTNTKSPSRVCDHKLGITMNQARYGQFLLSALLSPVLEKSRPSRIVFMSSELHRVEGFKQLRTLNEYCQNSLATILGARTLSDCLLNTGVTCNVVSPGLGWEDCETIFDGLKRWPR